MQRPSPHRYDSPPWEGEVEARRPQNVQLDADGSENDTALRTSKPIGDECESETTKPKNAVHRYLLTLDLETRILVLSGVLELICMVFWSVVLTVEVASDSPKARNVTWAFAILSGIVIFAGLGILFSNVDQQIKLEYNANAVHLVLGFMAISCIVHIVYHFDISVETSTSSHQIGWGVVIVILSAMLYDIATITTAGAPVPRWYLLFTWGSQSLVLASLLTGLHSAQIDGRLTQLVHDVYLSAFTLKFFIFPTGIGWLHDKSSRVVFMIMLDVITNLPIIIFSLSHPGLLSSPGIMFAFIMNTAQAIYDTVFEPTRSYLDESVVRNLAEPPKKEDQVEIDGAGKTDQEEDVVYPVCYEICQLVYYTVFWAVILTITIATDINGTAHIPAVVATFCFGIPSLTLVASGAGALASQAPLVMKELVIDRMSSLLAALLEISVVLQVCLYANSQSDHSVLVHIVWGILTVFGVALLADVLLTGEELGDRWTWYRTMVWLLQILSTTITLSAAMYAEDPAVFRACLSSFSLSFLLYPGGVLVFRTQVDRILFVAVLDLVAKVPAIGMPFTSPARMEDLSHGVVALMLAVNMLQSCFDFVLLYRSKLNHERLMHFARITMASVNKHLKWLTATLDVIKQQVWKSLVRIGHGCRDAISRLLCNKVIAYLDSIEFDWFQDSAGFGLVMYFALFWTIVLVLEAGLSTIPGSTIASTTMAALSFVAIVAASLILFSKVPQPRRKTLFRAAVGVVFLIHDVAVVIQGSLSTSDGATVSLVEAVWAMLNIMVPMVGYDPMYAFTQDIVPFWIMAWVFELAAVSSLLASARSVDVPEIRNTYLSSFGIKMLTFPIVVGALPLTNSHAEFTRARAMALLNVITNVPAILATVISNAHYQKSAVGLNLVICLLQSCYTLAFQIVRTLHDRDLEELEDGNEHDPEHGDEVGELVQEMGGLVQEEDDHDELNDSGWTEETGANDSAWTEDTNENYAVDEPDDAQLDTNLEFVDDQWGEEDTAGEVDDRGPDDYWDDKFPPPSQGPR